MESFWPVVGGMESQAQSLAEGFAAGGTAQLIITRRVSRDLPRDEFCGLLHIHRVSPVGGWRFARWLMVPSSFRALIKFKRRYDLIVVTGFRSLGIPGVIAGKLLGKMCVLAASSNGELSGKFFSSGLERLGVDRSNRIFEWALRMRNRLLAKADAFVGMSNELTEEFIQGGMPKEKLFLIPNAIDTLKFTKSTKREKCDLRKRLDLPDDVTIVIYVGRLVSYKGVRELVRAWQRICEHHENAVLLLVGGGGTDIANCEDEVRQFVMDSRLQDKVMFTGDVSNVVDYLRASDVFVFPTTNEAFGIALVEAMACGLPVISTATGAIRDIVKHEENGLLITPGNSSELYEAIDRLLTDSDLAEAIGESGRSTAQRYSIESVVRQYDDLYQKLLATRART